jgi:ubiquinone/menaquinone biosynthesis C-methylase UbiE
MKGHRWFAAIYERLSNVQEKSAAVRKIREEIVGGARGHVLEIGAGTGASFPYYGDDVTEVAAVEPDPFMLPRARKRAEEVSKPIEVHHAPAEKLPFEDDTFDTAISTLVLCSVSNPQKALFEIKRCLKPGGQLRVYEHVRYDSSFGGFWQDLVTPAWKWFGAGCHPNRDTGSTITDAGFKFESLRTIKDGPPVPPMVFDRPHIVGVATSV